MLNRPERLVIPLPSEAVTSTSTTSLAVTFARSSVLSSPSFKTVSVFPPSIGKRNRIVIRIRDVDLGQEPTALHLVIEINRDVGDDRSGICNCYRNRSERRSLDGTVKGDDFNSHLVAALEQLGRQCTLRLTMDDVPIDQPTIPKDHRLLIEILSFDTDADRPCKDQRTR